jgi:hypothetical protein
MDFLVRTSKRKELGLGPAKGKGKDGLSLADARLPAADARKKLTEGKDPAAERRAEKIAGITFGEFADALLQSIKSGFKGKKTYADWKRDLEVRCQPIRSKQLQEIKTTDLLAILSPMWLTINRTARETRSRIERVFMAARAKELCSGENPAIWRGNLKELLPKAKRSKRHHQAVPYKDVPRIVRALQEKHRSADSNVNLAAEFIILTAVRTGEARFMRATPSQLPWKPPRAAGGIDRGPDESHISYSAAPLVLRCRARRACGRASRPLSVKLPHPGPVGGLQHRCRGRQCCHHGARVRVGRSSAGRLDRALECCADHRGTPGPRRPATRICKARRASGATRSFACPMRANF